MEYFRGGGEIYGRIYYIAILKMAKQNPDERQGWR
jgi:hypothetical protein